MRLMFYLFRATVCCEKIINFWPVFKSHAACVTYRVFSHYRHVSYFLLFIFLPRPIYFLCLFLCCLWRNSAIMTMTGDDEDADAGVQARRVRQCSVYTEPCLCSVPVWEVSRAEACSGEQSSPTSSAKDSRKSSRNKSTSANPIARNWPKSSASKTRR